ncbi:MAG: hypothetical protein ACE5O2_03860 [Armatimonadota bacterium]
MARSRQTHRRQSRARRPLCFVVGVLGLSLHGGWAAPADDGFANVQRVVADACAAFSSYDHNDDGTVEIHRLARAPEGERWRYECPGSGRGLVLVIVEPRLFRRPQTGDSPDLRPALSRFVRDLARDGYDAILVRAAVYAGPRHQDGRTVLALREFLRCVASTVPDLAGAILVGNFPEAFLVRQYFWRKHTRLTLNKGTKMEEKYEQPIDYWRTRAEPVAMRCELVLADLDGDWQHLYHEGPEELPYAIAAFPEGEEKADGVTSHYEMGRDRFEDFFFVHDGRWRAEHVRGRRLRFVFQGESNDECAAGDLQLPNPIARPDVSVSRINAFHAAVQPDASVRGATGEGLLDGSGLPRSVAFAEGQQAPHPLSFWVRSEALERRLLAEYFDRNHRYRAGEYDWASNPASIALVNASRIAWLRKARAEWADFDAPGYDLAGDGVDLLGCVRWLQQPASLRYLSAHTDPWGANFAKTEDVEALHEAVGGTIWNWARLGNRLVPSLQQTSGKLDFAVLRTLYENGALPDCPNFWIHAGCDAISPAHARDRPYNAPGYGFWQGSECLLMYCNGLALMGRAKVFYDAPRGFAEALAEGGTWGDAWRRYFDVEAADENIEKTAGGIGRKRAYFWSTLGDWTLRITYHSR